MKHTIIECGRTALLILFHVSLVPWRMKLGKSLEPIALHPFLVHPCLAGTTAPGSNHQTYRNLQNLAQHFSIIISGGTKLPYARRVGFLPGTRYRIYGLQTGIALDGKEAQLTVVTLHQLLRCTFYRLRLETLHRHLHITLTGTDPYLTYQHIAEFEFLTVAQTDFIRTACLGSLYLQSPFSLSIGLRLIGLAVPGSTNFYHLVGIRSTPKVAFRLLLQYHIVAKDLWQFYFCLRCQSHGKQQSRT